MEKINIAICDDNSSAIRLLATMVEEILNDNKELCGSYSIMEVLTAEELLQIVDQVDYVFLDVEMPGMNGIDAGKEIHRINPQCEIVMATGKLEYVNEAFKINAKRYIQKPYQKRDVEEAIYYLIHSRVGQSEITVYKNRREVVVRQYDISYIRAYDGYVEFYIGDEVCRRDMSLSKLESILDNRIFFRINRTEIVNMRYISVRKERKIKYYFQGRELTISRRNEGTFSTAYREYDLHYRRG